MEEVKRLCDRISTIDKGRIVGYGTQEELKNMIGEEEIVELDFVTSEKEKIEELKPILPFEAKIKKNKIAIKCNKNKGLKEVLNQVPRLNLSIANIGGGLLKENGTLKRLLYAPLKTTDILFGKMLTALSISIVQLVFMFIFAGLAFGVNIFKDVPALLLMILCTAFAVAAFGIFIV